MCIYRDSSADFLGMSNNLYHQAWPIRWTCQIFQHIFFSFCEVKPWTVQAMFWNTQTVAELRYNAHTFHVEEIPYYTVLPQIFKLFILVVTPRIMGNCSNFPRSEKIRWDSRKNSLFITASRHSQHVIKQPSHVRLHVFWMYLLSVLWFVETCGVSEVCQPVAVLVWHQNTKLKEMKTKYVWVWVRLAQR